MGKKAVSGILLTLLLTSMLTLAFHIQRAKAEPGTIYIRADGSIDPPTALVYTEDNITYSLTGDITADASGIVIERDNMTLEGANHTILGPGRGPGDYHYGIYFTKRSNVTIRDSVIRDFDYGIRFNETSNTRIVGNSIANTYWGIFFDYSSNINVSSNIITNSSDGSIGFSNSNNNSILENNLRLSGSCGVEFYWSNHNIITRNNMSNGWGGIGLFSSFHNAAYENMIALNQHGFVVLYSDFNGFYHNTLTDNVEQVNSIPSDNLNTWDNGYHSGGNYWGIYAGVDVKSGPNQDLPGSDGIGDTPYIIDENNVDYYPLMNAYGAPPLPTYSLTITATVGGTTNPTHGTYTYTANSTVQVTATPEATYLFVYWELDGVNVGSANPCSILMNKDHLLKAVCLLIDIDGNGKIDMGDISIVLNAFGSYPTHPRWNPIADINSDGRIDMGDIIIVLTNFGQHYP